MKKRVYERPYTQAVKLETQQQLMQAKYVKPAFVTIELQSRRSILVPASANVNVTYEEENWINE
jgi:hypothetical protein